jgi:hypothetical protein
VAVIKSGFSSDQWVIDPISKAGRVTLYDAAGNPLVTIPISAAALPLPAGASSAANQTNGAQKTQNVDGSGNIRPAGDAPNRAIYVQGTISALEQDSPTLRGVYYYHSGAQLVQAAADAATAGRFWLINPVGSGVTVRIKSAEFSSQLGSALVAVTSPRIMLERVTFTGSASGAAVVASKRKTADLTPASLLVTASTGLSLTAGAAVCGFFPIASATAVGYCPASCESFEPEVNDRIDLAPGEGLVIRQADPGTASDTRRFSVDFIVEEF